MPDPNTQRAIDALARLGKNMSSGSPIGAADVMQPDENPGDAYSKLYGAPRREDIALPAEPEPTGLPWLMRKLKGMLGPSETPTPTPQDAMVFQGDANGVGQRIR